MRKRKDFVRLEGVRSARLVVIAGEGRCTEPIYFSAIKEKFSAPNVHVEILTRDSNKSSPKDVYDRIENFMQQYNIEDDDELWLVIDRDRWHERMLSQVAQLCSQNRHLHFCMSNPCFELWLLLHLEDIRKYDERTTNELTSNKKNKAGITWLKKRMRDLLGAYSESNYDVERLLPHVQKAMSIAKELDINPADRWPQGIGTRVYLLISSIIGNTPGHP